MNKPWKLVVGIEAFYLTDREKEFYLTSISKGAKFVQVNEYLMLGANFQSLQHEEVMTERDQIEDGRFKCEYGRWHSKAWKCMCAPLEFDKKTQSYIKAPETKIVHS